MIDLELLRAGDIGLVHGKTFMAKRILWFMEQYRKISGVKKRKLYNHAFMVIEFNGKKLIAEALVSGITIREWPEYYTKLFEKGDIKIKRISGNWFKDYERISEVAIESTFNPTRYDFLNFIHQIILIVFGKWVGPTGDKATNRLYCTEAVATWWNMTKPGIFSSPTSTNPLNIDTNERFIDLKLNNNSSI